MKRASSAYGPGLVGMVLIGGTLATLAWLERRRPLRAEVESKTRRNVRNLAVAGLASGVIQAVEAPLVGPLAELVERRRWGLLPRLPLPARLRGPLAQVLLDYTFYLWHVGLHRVPWLWRFHRVHHVDRDMDVSTALRFHFGEMALSAPFRAAQVVVIGVSPRTLKVWQTLSLIEILFHHSNVELPPWVERWLSRLIVTPRLHGIHHSTRLDETDSNWSSGLTVWDWLHRTLRRDVPQDAIEIGVPAYRDPAAVALPRLIALPFGPRPPAADFSAEPASPSRPRAGRGELE